ncbi:MAG TPA: ABC transporter ATP-binding protein [Crocinitomicaceae bacterium]|nr:ABC transporter ATP-binding protein [Crocinitomicaceae bacterium]
MIQFKNHTVSIENTTLFKVDELVVEQGKVYYLIGKNGSGKSTFLKSIINFNDKTAGISIDNKSKNQYSSKELAQKIAYVPSKLTSNDFTTVEEFLLLGRYPYGKPLSGTSEHDQEKLNEVLNLLEINDLKTKFINQLSDGQQQLVSIGRALVQEVNYLLLDEPTAFLDYANKRRIFARINELASAKNMGIIVVTHDIEFLLKLNKDVFYVDTNSKSLETLNLSNDDLEEVVRTVY